MLDGATLEERYAYNRMLLYKKLNNDTHYVPMYAEGDKRGNVLLTTGYSGLPSRMDFLFIIR